MFLKHLSDEPRRSQFCFQALAVLLICWQLVCAVPGALLPVFAVRCSEGESADTQSETPAEERELEAESIDCGLLSGRTCNERRKINSDRLRFICAAGLKQLSCCNSRPHIYAMLRHGFRSCRLC